MNEWTELLIKSDTQDNIILNQQSYVQCKCVVASSTLAYIYIQKTIRWIQTLIEIKHKIIV